MDSHAVFIHIHQGCFAGTGAIVRLPQCQWSKPDGYGKISQCITTTKHSKAKTVCIFLGIYCSSNLDIRKNNMNPLLASTSLKRQSVGVVLLIKLLRSMLYAHASKLQFGKKKIILSKDFIFSSNCYQIQIWFENMHTVHTNDAEYLMESKKICSPRLDIKRTMHLTIILSYSKACAIVTHILLRKYDDQCIDKYIGNIRDVCSPPFFFSLFA